MDKLVTIRTRYFGMNPSFPSVDFLVVDVVVVVAVWLEDNNNTHKKKGGIGGDVDGRISDSKTPVEKGGNK